MPSLSAICICQINFFVANQVTQIQYLDWPDHGAPDNSLEITAVARAVNDIYSADTSVPMAVHCSAGIGRAGSFLCIDAADDWLNKVGNLL
jgi:protein tyrosine phosphatase